MKIGDVKVGTAYGAHDEPARKHTVSDPRQVRVLEVVTVEQRVYGSNVRSAFTNDQGHRFRNLRRVKVEVLDLGPEDAGQSYYRTQYPIRFAQKGEVIVIEPRHLLGLWKDLSGAIGKRIKEEQELRAAREALEARVVAIVGGKPDYDRFRLKVRSPHPSQFEIEFKGKTLDLLLALAEKGKAAS